jgi:hypothetical protein
MTFLKMSYILYKNALQLDTLKIVRYLHFNGKSNLPKYVIERSHPEWVTELPSLIEYDGTKHIGKSEVIKYYENKSGIDDILNKANLFSVSNPNYTIN